METTLTKQSAKVLKALARDLQKLGISKFRYGDISLEFGHITATKSAVSATVEPQELDDPIDEDLKPAPTPEETRRLAHDRMLYWSATHG